MVFSAAVQKTHRAFLGRPGAQPRDDCRERHDADGQHGASGQVVEKRAFARLETTEHCHINAVAAAVELFPARGDLRLEIGKFQFPGQTRDAIQNAIHLIHVSNVLVVTFVFHRIAGFLAIEIHPMFFSVSFNRY